MGDGTPFAVERFLALQAYLEALPRLLQMPVPDSLKRQFCITCRDTASSPHRPHDRLEHINYWRANQMFNKART